MNDYIEIPEELPEGWPTAWSGNTVINCGEHGSFCLEVATEGHPSLGHIDNYREILRRWPQLWPRIHAVLSDMLASYERDYQIRNPGASLDMRIPPEPIKEGVQWGVGAKFYHGEGQWDVVFDGWTAVPDESQPYF